MKDFTLSPHNLQSLINALQDELQSTPLLLVTTSDPATGKWGMAKLWRAWMATTGEGMAQQGATMPPCSREDGTAWGSRPFNANDAHELFTMRWLGSDSTGTRLSWAKADHDGMRAATRGERYHAMVQHEAWAGDRGIILIKPRDSEYAEIEREGNG